MSYEISSQFENSEKQKNKHVMNFLYQELNMQIKIILN